VVKVRLREIRNDLGWRLRRYRAKRARAQSKAIFIGITGSSGKSTATSLLGHILAGHGSVHTQVLANTLKALVRTLYKRMRRAGEVDYVVFEAGAFEPGSIQAMAQMLKPDVALVTMIRLEHVGKFRTLEAVAREKGALIDALKPCYTVGDELKETKEHVWVLRAATVPAVTVLCGNIDNERDRAFMSNAANQEKIARSILEGVIHYNP